MTGDLSHSVFLLQRFFDNGNTMEWLMKGSGLDVISLWSMECRLVKALLLTGGWELAWKRCALSVKIGILRHYSVELHYTKIEI